MANCFKCNQAVGDDAVQLKNGMFCCPQCYGSPASTSFAQPTERASSGFPVGGIVALLLVVGGAAFGWKAYSDNRESERLALIEKNKADEAAAQRERDMQAEIVAENRRQAEAGRRAQAAAEALAKQQQDVARKQAEAYKAARDAETAVAERKQAEANAQLAAQRAAADQAKQKEQAAERERMAGENANRLRDRIAEVLVRIHGYEAKIAEAPAQKQALMKQQTIFRNVLQGAQSKVDLNDKLRQDFPEDQKQSPEYKLIMSRLKSAQAEAKETTEKLETATSQLKDLEFSLTALQARIADERKRLATFNPTPDQLAAAEVAAAAMATALNTSKPTIPNAAKPAVAATPGGRSIVKKDGTVIAVKSFFKADDEYHYKDTDGKSGVIKADQVERVDQ